MGDNLDNIHFPTVEKLNKIFRLFVAEYLQLFPPQFRQKAEDNWVIIDYKANATMAGKTYPTAFDDDEIHN